MVQIPIVNRPGVFALVSNCDADLARHRWFLKPSKSLWYVVRSVRQGEKILTIRLHRVVGERIHGRPLDKGLDVHHEQSDTLDNRREKLEVVDHDRHGLFSHEASEYDRYLEAKYGAMPC
jgi:hypothetical protein